MGVLISSALSQQKIPFLLFSLISTRTFHSFDPNFGLAMSTIFTVYKLQPISDEMDSRPYIGATGNYRMRIHFHRSDYKRYPNRPVYSAMRANGGFENYRPVIVEQFLESDYEEGVAMRLASNLEAKLVSELIPLKGCLNRELPGRSGRDSVKAWRAAKIAADPDGFVTL
jgi:hypothetical protein